MFTNDQAQGATRQSMKRRDFLQRAGWGSVGATGLIIGASRSRALAHPPSPYPSWTPASDKPPKRGGILTRASAWDPPVLDPRLTNSVGLSQIATLVYNRLLRYPFTDEAKNNNDLTLKGDLAESWEGSADFKTWTFKLHQGVKWHNVPPLKGRELVADDIKYCYEAYAQEGVQTFTFQEIDGMETPDKYTIRIHLKTPNTMFPNNVAEAVTTIFPREVLEEDGDLKSRMIGTGPFILKDNQRKVKVVLARNPDYFDKGFPYIDEYRILSTPDAATRLAAFRTGQSDALTLQSLADVETLRKTNPKAVVQEVLTAFAHLASTCVRINHPSTMCEYAGPCPWLSTDKSKWIPSLKAMPCLAGGFRIFTGRMNCPPPPTSAPIGSIARRKRRSSWPRPAMPRVLKRPSFTMNTTLR